jgi:hypothetical protein
MEYQTNKIVLVITSVHHIHLEKTKHSFKITETKKLFSLQKVEVLNSDLIFIFGL